MSLDRSRVVRDVTTRLPTAATAGQACQATVAALGRHTPGPVAVLLWVHDRLRCVAATGSWQVFASAPGGVGVVGRVFAAGKAETVSDVTNDPDYVPLRPDVQAEICAPILDASGRPIGVLDMEWTTTGVDLDAWRETIEQVAARLGTRIGQLGGPPAETRSEKLLRHASALTSATTEPDLMTAAVRAARDVAGLRSAVFVLDGPSGPWVATPGLVPDELEARVHAALAGAGRPLLEQLRGRAHRSGTSYTLGEGDHPTTADQDLLIAAGVRTLISVPLGPTALCGVLLVGDTRTLRPDPTTVNLIELLAAQSWICLERLRGLARLREQASSDPLTGLRHQGSFGERIAESNPGRTALLAVDVDGFKAINDTYGHQAGDRVLVDLARALQGALRHGDELYRIGGDEFVAVVEVLRPEEAVGIAERLAEAARRIGRTISVGVAVQRDGESPELTLRRADEALYGVKRQGRDGVGLATAG
ncbi:sensor domain-containing diguanylate cyclase [Plantactinospora sp. S1510]|uniref:Sensor domain-containing diguanylate cyclase n=1 Tax=Plantactinospora alkalitolerans TaxID=2789879 RepID=A0ABS0GTM0_9ACTN|nr:sensor domain-containing diguanylate cyclase [Plantactinospora alkalitolerans]MBF9129436.1 sensor domain-containing diguanylate cyclase [Plantactinospora alkalitolerans]